MTTATASVRGRSNREKGAVSERHLARWLRDHGWPHAERAVRTGFTAADRAIADPGDITGTPGLVWQVKYRADFDQDAVFATCWHETGQQRATANADFGLLVQRRPRAAHPGRWWVWLGVLDLLRLHTPGERNPLAATSTPRGAPVRMELADLVPLLHSAGYGTPAEVV